MNMITKFHMLTFDHSFLLLGGWRVRCWLGSPWRKLCPSLSRVGSSSNWFRLNKKGRKEARKPTLPTVSCPLTSWVDGRSSRLTVCWSSRLIPPLHCIKKGVFIEPKIFHLGRIVCTLTILLFPKTAKNKKKVTFFSFFAPCTSYMNIDKWIIL